MPGQRENRGDRRCPGQRHPFAPKGEQRRRHQRGQRKRQIGAGRNADRLGRGERIAQHLLQHGSGKAERRAAKQADGEPRQERIMDEHLPHIVDVGGKDRPRPKCGRKLGGQVRIVAAVASSISRTASKAAPERDFPSTGRCPALPAGSSFPARRRCVASPSQPWPASACMAAANTRAKRAADGSAPNIMTAGSLRIERRRTNGMAFQTGLSVKVPVAPCGSGSR